MHEVEVNNHDDDVRSNDGCGNEFAELDSNHESTEQVLLEIEGK